MQHLRSLAFNGLWTLWTAAFSLVLVAVWVAGSNPATVRSASRVWARGVLFGLRWVVGLGFVERGRENIPAVPCLVVANHQSTWETIALLVLLRDVAVVTKHELLDVPIFGWFLRRSPMIVIDRESGSKAIRKMVDEGAAALAQGRHVLIFPEGTRSLPSAPVEFKRGVELLYAKLGRPVLPIALNSGDYWGPAQKTKRPGTITISYLEPLAAGLPAQAAMKDAEGLIQQELDRIRQCGAG